MSLSSPITGNAVDRSIFHTSMYPLNVRAAYQKQDMRFSDIVKVRREAADFFFAEKIYFDKTVRELHCGRKVKLSLLKDL